MLPITLLFQRKYLINISCRMMHELKVSVVQGLLMADVGNWLVCYEKLKKEYASFYIEFG